MIAHTPEPWRLDDPDDVSPAIVDEQYHVICAGEWGQPDGTGFRLAGFIRPPDARLVTAAPGLLRELQNVVAQAERWPFLSVGMLVGHHSNIRAVIEKAGADPLASALAELRGLPGERIGLEPDSYDRLYAAAQALADEATVSSEPGSDLHLLARRVLEALHELIPERMNGTPLEAEEEIPCSTE